MAGCGTNSKSNRRWWWNRYFNYANNFRIRYNQYVTGKIKIDKKDNYISLKTLQFSSKLILRSLKLIEQNNYKFVEQNKNNISYAKKINKKSLKSIGVYWLIILLQKSMDKSFSWVWFLHKGTRFKIVEAMRLIKVDRLGKF